MCLFSRHTRNIVLASKSGVRGPSLIDRSVDDGIRIMYMSDCERGGLGKALVKLFARTLKESGEIVRKVEKNFGEINAHTKATTLKYNNCQILEKRIKERRCSMSLEENKTVVRRLIEAENERNYALFDEVMAPDFIMPDTLTRDRETYKQACKTFVKGVPDFHGTIEDIIAEGDKVWVRGTYTGTHKGEYFGLAPTGKKVTMTAVAIYRIVDAKVVEMWTLVGMDFFKGLGVIEYTEEGKKLFPEGVK